MSMFCRVPVLMAACAWTMLGAGLLSTAARAQSSEEHTDFKDEFNNVLGYVGFGHDRDVIDYAPRAPIVVPPTNNLPPPAEAVRRPSADFPVDPDVSARRQALIDPRRPVIAATPGSGAGPRAYLIDPPSAYLDASAVAATGHNVDRGDAPGETSKKTRHHHNNQQEPQ